MTSRDAILLSIVYISLSYAPFPNCVYFSRIDEKQWRRKTAKTRKTPKIQEKGPKTVKMINIEIFAILYFPQMEFKLRKSWKIDPREKNTFYSIMYYVFLFFLANQKFFLTVKHDIFENYVDLF